MSGANQCAMCGNKPADRGLMCPPCREADRAFSDDCCQCVQCREGLTHIMPCSKDDEQ